MSEAVSEALILGLTVPGMTLSSLTSMRVAGVLSRSVRQRQNRIFHLTHDKQRMRVLHRAIYQAVADGNPTKAMGTVDEHFRYLDELQEDVMRSSATKTG